MECDPATKGPGSVVAGLEMLYELLQLDEHGAPVLLIHPRCVNLIAEMEGLIWKPLKDEYNEKGRAGTKGPDHAVDALRYGIRMYREDIAYELFPEG